MSNKKVLYQQCRLQKGTTHQMSWIPAKYAVKGKTLKLRSNGEWEDGWVVNETYATRMDDDLPDSHAEIKSHRKATGDS